MGLLAALTTVSGTIKASDHNGNYSAIRTHVNTYAVLTDVVKTITVSHVYSASQTFTGGWTAGAACTVSTGGLTVTAGGVTVSAGGATIVGNTVITGTLTTSSVAVIGVDPGGSEALRVGGALRVNASTMIATATNFSNGAAAATGTLTNAPTAGNPTKWIPVVDNGTTRYIPAW